MFEDKIILFTAEIVNKQYGEVTVDPASVATNLENVGGFSRQARALVKVLKKEHVKAIVDVAREFSVSLYPFSRGCNWGYGSKLPPTDGAVLLDLSGLNELSIDEDHGIATIQPGVSQRQLASELLKRNSRYFLDVTGSGAETSVLGNALERGVAYGSLRVQQLAGFEVVLGDGSVVRTGFGEYNNPVLAGLYSYGLGPSLESLFFQSNFGIVTEAKLQLSLRPEKLVALSIAVQNDNLEKFVDAIAELKKTGVIYGIPHLADRERMLSTLAPLVMDEAGCDNQTARQKIEKVVSGDWVLTVAVAGPTGVVNQKLLQVKKLISNFGKIYTHHFNKPRWKTKTEKVLMKFLASADQQLVIKASEKLRGFHQGIPSDAGIRFLLDSAEKSVDQSNQGFLLCTPLAPLSGYNACLLYKLTSELAHVANIKYAMTLNIISDRVLEAVISVHFNRQCQTETLKAHAFHKSLNAHFSLRGFYPYRININEQVEYSEKPNRHAIMAGKIKRVLDPGGIIAPGRYL